MPRLRRSVAGEATCVLRPVACSFYHAHTKRGCPLCTTRLELACIYFVKAYSMITCMVDVRVVHEHNGRERILVVKPW